jgi:energy-coupling factor transporter ATP-binding protein EcfA2
LIIELMFELNAESGATLVLVTHDPDLATRCERVLTIAEGQLVADVRAARSGGVRPSLAAVAPMPAVANAVDQPPGQPRVLT